MGGWGANRIIVSLRLGRTKGARFEGDPKPVLAAVAMVLLCVLGVAYLVTTSTSCSSERAFKFATTFFKGGAR